MKDLKYLLDLQLFADDENDKDDSTENVEDENDEEEDSNDGVTKEEA